MEKKSILLVEDDELDVISVQRSLARFRVDAELHTAYNGIEALKLLRTEQDGRKYKPDVILLDMNMPKMNGYEFLKELRKDSSLNDIKIVVMTTSNESSDRTKMEELGVSAYLIKPMMFTENTKHQSSMDAFVQFHLPKILN